MEKDRVMTETQEDEVECIACLTKFRPALKRGKVKCPGCGIVWRIPLPHGRRAGSRGADRETNPTGDKL
jgi:predicted RNA-binding Zn-ribbon protein involved in translation (DUF1610 family)